MFLPQPEVVYGQTNQYQRQSVNALTGIRYDLVDDDGQRREHKNRWQHRVSPCFVATLHVFPASQQHKSRRHQRNPFGQTYEGTAGTGPAEQRLSEQDRDGIDAEVMYPCQVGGPWLWRSVPDDEPYLAIVRAYNDWLAQEYCAVSPQRLIGLGMVPMSNIGDAVAETKRCAKLGLPGMLLSAFPSNKGYPTPEDDRFWATAQELNMPVTVHIQLNREGVRSGPLLRYPKEDPEVMKKLGTTGLAEQVSRFHRVGGLNVVQMVLDGLFDRFPNLNIYFAETHAGWLPFFMHMADLRYDRHQSGSTPPARTIIFGSSLRTSKLTKPLLDFFANSKSRTTA